MKIDINKKVLSANEQAAADNAAFFRGNGVFCVNMISSPGSGKTTILARTVAQLQDRLSIGVIEGDIKTDIDAQKIRQAGAAAVQIETEGACHLTAAQVASAMRQLPAADMDIVFIENVGNLVCPAAFELGETAKVVVLSTAEGDDKPAKYPGTFAKAAAILINKIDLLGVLDFDMDRVIADARRVNPDVKIFPVSAKTGHGMDQWYEWLQARTL